MPQVSFYRANLCFSVVAKQYGRTEDGKPLPLEGLAVFIRCFEGFGHLRMKL